MRADKYTSWVDWQLHRGVALTQLCVHLYMISQDTGDILLDRQHSLCLQDKKELHGFMPEC